MFVGTVVNADTGDGVCVGFAITATDQERGWPVGEGEPARALATEGETVNATQIVKTTISALRKIANNKPGELFLFFDAELGAIGYIGSLILQQNLTGFCWSFSYDNSRLKTRIKSTLPDSIPPATLNFNIFLKI
jgi:hypothetical protein